MSLDPAEDHEALPGSLTLKPDRARWLLVFLICGGFVAIAIWLGPGDPLIFYGAGGFFLLCALIAAPLMFGVGASLTLHLEGFTCRTLFKSFHRRWQECSAFYPVSTGIRRNVGFSTAQDESAHPRLAAANRALVGASGMLPDNFGLAAEELAHLMNQFRARSLGQ